MIRKAADFQRFVRKPFVQCFVYRRERNIVAPVVEDGVQTLVLFFTVAEDVKGIVVLQELVERVRNQIKILLKQRLRSCLKLQDGIWGVRQFRIEPQVCERFNR